MSFEFSTRSDTNKAVEPQNIEIIDFRKKKKKKILSMYQKMNGADQPVQ